MAKKLSLSEAQLAASGKLPQQQDVMGDAPKAARIPKVVRKHLVVVAPLDAPTTPQEAILDGNLEPVSDEKMKAALMRAEKRMQAKQASKTVAGKPQILDEAKVKEIIRLSDAGSKPSELAKQFGVAPSHISNIIRGVTWIHVTGRHYVKGAYKAAKAAKVAQDVKVDHGTERTVKVKSAPAVKKPVGKPSAKKGGK